MIFLRKLVDFYLYSSIHIALGAALSVVLCYGVLAHIPTSDYSLFVFTSTIFLYCSHRIVGIKKLEQFEHEGRFAVIKKFQTHLMLYAIIGGLASIYFYVNLSTSLQLWLLAPGLISILYISPIFSRRRRLRDFHLIKIFIIAIIWGFIIGWIPYFESQGTLGLNGLIYGLEKVFFIFAITLPFDVRDMLIDKANDTKTIPTAIGEKKSYKIAYLSMAVVMFSVIFLYSQKVYSTPTAIAMGVSYQITGFAIQFSKSKTDDYYFSGILDGMIAIVAIAGIYASGILKIMF